MDRRGRLLLFLAALAVGPPALCAAEADKAAQVFESLYGADVQRVRSTRDPKDDIDLATRLIAAAKEAAGQPEFLVLLCEKAADLASAGADGIPTFLAAMEFEAAHVPERAAACAERIADMRQKQFDAARGDERAAAGAAFLEALLAAADGKEDADACADAAAFCRRAQTVAKAVKSDRAAAIDARLRALVQRMAAVREVERLKEQLAKDPADKAARERLVRLYLVDLDDPEEAAKGLEGVADETLRKYVPAAAKGFESAPELACMELGEWYRGLGDSAAAGSKPAMLARAQAYYERFLSLHKAEDLDRTKAALALRKVEAALKAAGGPPRTKAPATGQWIDLLALVDLVQDRVQGTWQRQAGALALTAPDPNGRMIIPLCPAGSYEMEVKFARLTGSDTVGITLPVADNRVVLFFSAWYGRAGGLDMVGGKNALGNETKISPHTLENAREYTVQVRVQVDGDQAQITATLDGKGYVNWRGASAVLSEQGLWRLPRPRCMGLGASNSTIVFRSARLRMLSGEAKLLRPQGQTPSASAPAGGVLKPGPWTDLLALVDPAKDAVLGACRRVGAAIEVTHTGNAGRFQVPIAVQGDYELDVAFVRATGSEAVAIVLPVGSGSVLFVLSGLFLGSGRDVYADGLFRVNGKEPPDNGAGGLTALKENGHEYRLNIKVATVGGEAAITSTLDGRPHIQWRGPPGALSLPGHWVLPERRALGLGTTKSTAVFRSVRLRMLSGEAKLLRP